MRAISQLHADLLFLGSCGVDIIQGITAFDSTEAEVKRAMASNCAEIVIAATRDKLGTAAPFRVAVAKAIQHLVVDRSAPQEILVAFKNLGTVVHVV